MSFVPFALPDRPPPGPKYLDDKTLSPIHHLQLDVFYYIATFPASLPHYMSVLWEFTATLIVNQKERAAFWTEQNIGK